MLIEELHRQRLSSRSIIESKNKLIADMAKQLGEKSRMTKLTEDTVSSQAKLEPVKATKNS